MAIEDFRDKLVRELSTGSKRIVDLACVMAHEPSVLLLDEPSSGIAQREAEALGPLLLRIREQTGASLLLIEHDVPLMLSVADRVVALDLGNKIADGDPQTAVHDPAVVESYLGGGVAVARSGARA
jgi:branched-chain amino acid transport system ATP-binding protein